MSNRITNAMLENAVEFLNELTDSPKETYVKKPNGKYEAQIGNYHLSGAYGGVSLHRICTKGGGVEDVFSCGHIPKRLLFEKIRAFRLGLIQRGEK